MTTEETHLLAIPLEISETELTEMISINIICRLCANQCDKLIGIYSEDGISNDIANKMNLYLPIKVSETDNLPLQCCWECASTLLAWHDLFVTSIEADRRLKSYQFVTEKQLQDIVSYGGVENILPTSPNETMAVDEAIITDTISFSTVNESQLLNEESLSQSCSRENAEVNTDEDTDLRNLGNTNTCYLSVRKDIMESIDISVQNCKEESVDGQKDNRTICSNSGSSDFKEEELEETVDDVSRKLECPFCPKLFTAPQGIIEHVKLEHPHNDRVECKPNDPEKVKSNKKNNFKQSTKKKKLIIRNGHVRNTTKRPKQKIDYDLVNKAQVVVDGRVFYKCSECGKSLGSMYTFMWHIRIHTGERPFVCDLCGKRFRVSQGLVRHLKETHERIKNFDCDICGRFFATRRNVEEHRRIHTNERPYVCALCGKAFKQKASLFVHNRSHNTEFSFECSHCPQKFRTKQSLSTHITKHTGEKPYPCDVCGRHFRIKYELKRHKLIHSEDKPFSCKMCGQTFRQKRYLRNHLKLNHHINNPGELNEMMDVQ